MKGQDVPVLVTGPTGNVGTEVIGHLIARGFRPVAAVVPGELNARPEMRGRLHGVEEREFDFTAPATWDALADIERIFLMRPPHIANIRRDMLPFLQHIRKKGVGHVVFLSVQGAESNRLVPHHKVEQVVVSLGLPYTFIRPAFFMQNLTTTHLPEIRDDRRIFVPAGEGRTNFIDVRDIGEAVAETFVGEHHRNQAYTVTGPASFTYTEVAARLSEMLGTEILYVNAPIPRFIRYHRRHGRTLGHALVMVALYSVARLGKADATTDTLRTLLGRDPRTLDEFIRDHRDILLGYSR